MVIKNNLHVKKGDVVKIKISEIHKGKIVSEQSRMKMSISQRKRKGRPISNETRLKLSAARKGKKHSEETKAKMSASAKGKNTWCKGRKLSTESINKIRIALLGKKRPPHVGMAVAAANKRRALA